jgi:methylated-DNA-[protein]-cysteine S-methyltransferase
MTRFARIDSPLGPLLAVAEAGGLTGLYFEGAKHSPAIDPGWREDSGAPLFLELARQLREYFAGERRAFDLPLAWHGTTFQQRIWREIARVPYGKTITYSELGAAAHAREAARAVGAATGRNPFTLVVPCHRIVGTNGSLTGYAGGIERKARLLALEGSA